MIYVSSPGKYDPPIGDYLGELTNELKKGDHSVEFVPGGPYGMKRMVLDPSETTITVTNPQKICRDKRKRKLYNREEEKNYQMVYTKRRRLDNYDTEPFGY